MRIELPRLDPIRCASHGECLVICPTECLEMEAGRPWLARPADCIACALCELVCPRAAIHMEAVPLN
jgi:NAD-dependent dihydropyrimidine dehydrogenase PreA subunit